MSSNLRNRKVEELLAGLCQKKMELPTLPVDRREKAVQVMMQGLALVIKHSFKECAGNNVHGHRVAYARVKVFAPEAEESEILGLLLSREDSVARNVVLRRLATGWLVNGR